MADFATLKFDPPVAVKSITPTVVGLPLKGWNKNLVWIPLQLIPLAEHPKPNDVLSTLRVQEWWVDKWLPNQARVS